MQLQLFAFVALQRNLCTWTSLVKRLVVCPRAYYYQNTRVSVDVMIMQVTQHCQHFLFSFTVSKGAYAATGCTLNNSCEHVCCQPLRY